MRPRTSAKKNPPVGVMPKPRPREPWCVKSVKALSGFRLHVQFMDGLEGEVDVSGLILSKNPGVFAALANPKKFNKVFIDLGAVAWPGDLDLAPDAMYDEIKKNGEYKIRRD